LLAGESVFAGGPDFGEAFLKEFGRADFLAGGALV
jgi:hypothetical protein